MNKNNCNWYKFKKVSENIILKNMLKWCSKNKKRKKFYKKNQFKDFKIKINF